MRRSLLLASCATLACATNPATGAKQLMLVSESQETIAPTGPAVTEFHVSKAKGWPAGKYKVEISVDGAPAGTQDFEVKK